MKNSIRLAQVTQLGFSTILVVTIGMGIIYQVTTHILITSTNWVTHTYKIQSSLKDLEKNFIDAETGQRGFLITGKTDFLEPYQNSLQNRNKIFEQIEDFIRDNPEQIDHLQALRKLSQERLEYDTKVIELKRNNQEKVLNDLLATAVGKKIMDEIRAQLGEMDKIEEILLNERKEAAQKAERISTIVSASGTFIATVLGILSLFLIARKVVKPINDVVSMLANSSTEIAVAVTEQERIASQQASSVNQTTTTMDELNASSQLTAQQAESAAAGARQALAIAQTGNKTVESSLVGMETLKIKVDAIAQQILHFSAQTTQISSITSLVSELAMQTNMLALNAAVEAVRAGNAGKGFGVVAAEIRKLADQSKTSAEKISFLVGDIEKAIASTVKVTQEGTSTVEEGVKIAQMTADAFSGVSDSINNIVFSTQQISLTAKQQAIAIQQVVDAMNELNESAVQSASGISQTKVSTQKLNEAALHLKAVV